MIGGLLGWLASLTETALPVGAEQQDAPLTEDEKKLLGRLFSDPTYFPVEFRTWLKNYIEGSGATFPASSIIGGVGGAVINLPAGIILPYAGTPKAGNILACDGRELLREDYKKLFDAIGTSWGTPSAGDKFKIPDYRDRALFGAGSQVPFASTDGRANGSRGGPRHKHTFSQTSGNGGTHAHSLSGASASGGGQHNHVPGTGNTFALTNLLNQNVPSSGSATYAVGGGTGVTNTVPDHTHPVSGGTDTAPNHTHGVSGDTSGGFDTDRCSFAGINYVITTGV